MIDAEQNKIQLFAFVISMGAAVLFSTGFVVSSFIRYMPPQAITIVKLENQINPNDAAIVSLIRLPGIGIGRAEAIVAYRVDFARKTNRPAFEAIDDLQKVKGIGPKTAQNINKWLKFE